MGTTKLTRKEIRSTDPVRERMILLVGLFQANRAKIGVAIIAIIVLALGSWALSRYLDSCAQAASATLGMGMSFFTATVSPDASENDPYARGDIPRFVSEEARYLAAAKEFSAAAGSFGAGEAGRTARYYLGLTQLRLGQNDEAIRNLESVAFGSGNRTVGFLAKKVLADYQANSGNVRAAEDLLRGMIGDTRFDLPKEALGMQLAAILVADGRRDEAIRVLREASDASPIFGVYNQQLLSEIERLQRTVSSEDAPFEEPSRAIEEPDQGNTD